MPNFTSAVNLLAQFVIRSADIEDGTLVCAASCLRILLVLHPRPQRA